MTCYIDPLLIPKIEKGEFVDLEKLLPKDKLGSRSSSELKMEWIRSEEGTFLVPSTDRSNKINNFRHWEQAFRAYATIYCGANPHRSKEIWQYVSIIHSASTAYVWDNVANYDFTFRHLMAFNPERSWAITYQQMWSLSMREPLPKNHMPRNVNYYGGGNGSSAMSSYTNTNSNSNSNPKETHLKKLSKAPDYCWSFNKGKVCKYGDGCRYYEKCSNCDSPAHGVNTCPKLDKKDRILMQQQLGKRKQGNANFRK